jgi:porin-like protein
MKMVKSLLLGSAAGLVAVAGAQAADMPVKAKPVEYVKVCSLYGEGFFYVPGTDTCLKLGGYLRVQVEMNAGAGGIVTGSQQMGPQGRFTRDLTNDVNYRVRAVASWDVRTQTEYGTLRTYIRAGWANETPGVTGGGTTPGPFWDRAFMQFAGFTVGRAQSFFDIYTYGGAQTFLNVRTSGDTGASGQNLWAYTAQFGNGFSGTLSLEDPATRKGGGTVDLTCTDFFPLNAGPTQDNGLAINGAPCAAPTAFGFRVPDVIANLRVDQAWGYASVTGALHDASGAYWQTPNVVNNGHPPDKYGWAVAVGAMLNMDYIARGDRFGFQITYGEGATGFVTNSSWWSLYDNSNRAARAWATDAVFDTGTTVELTKAWNINAAYEHRWNDKWRTTYYGGYVNVDYSGAATNMINARMPAGSFCKVGAAAGTITGFTPLAGNSCNPDFSFYQTGSRTMWNPVRNLDIGVDILYTKIRTAYGGPTNWVANGSRPACTNSAALSCAQDDQDVWSAMFRWQRNFYP